MKRLIALLGQTASGKSDIAVDLAKKLGETIIINCDSRQVYKRLDLLSGKVEGKWANADKICGFENLTYLSPRVFVYQDIPHFLIDFVDLSKRFTLVDFINGWIETIESIFKLVPSIENFILIGGTNLYAEAILNEYQLANVDDNNWDLAKKNLEKLSLLELQKLVSVEDLNQSDYANPRRLINYILRNQFADMSTLEYPKFDKKYVFAIDIDSAILKEKIYSRILVREEQGMLKEMNGLNISYNRLFELGLECRVLVQYQLGWITDWKGELNKQIIRYAKRQKTWLRKQKLIWIKNVDEMINYIDKGSK